MARWTLIIAGHCWVLLALFLASGCADRVPAPATPVLLVTVDTLRADHLGCYGCRRPTSPHLDRLARAGHLFLDAWCPMPTTTPSHAALLTGRHPRSLGVLSNGGLLPQDAVTLAEVLADRGYDTAAFVGAYPVHARFGLNQGFQTYSGPEKLSRKADQVVDEALRWLAQRDGKCFFLWVHLWDPHTPYFAPEEYRERFQVPAFELPLKFAFIRRPGNVSEEIVEKTVAAYDAEIGWTDHNIGRLLASMKRHGHYDRSLIAVTADHGESMAELLESRAYAFDHGEFLYRHQLSVPLMIKPPGEPNHTTAARHAAPVSLLDLMPTLLDLLGLETPEETEGRSLEPLLAGQILPPRAVIAQRRLFTRPPFPFLAGEQLSVTRDGWHLLTAAGGDGSPELFDLVNDPGETVNRFGDEEAVGEQLLDLLRKWQERGDEPDPAAMPAQDPVVRERLRALGYAE